MATRTKIVCTMGPSVHSYEKIIELIHAGMNVARINFSHSTHADHLQTIELLKKARADLHVPLAIMLDTKGPEIRIGKIRAEGISLKAGQKILLVKDAVEGDGCRVQMTPSAIFDSIEVGTQILIDDGYIVSTVVSKDPSGILIELANACVLKSNKGVNIPNAAIDLPAMTEQDVDDITFGCIQDVDIIAASFIRSEDHVMEIKRLLMAQGRPDILVIAKIENPQGVANFDAIAQVADGIMVARGDLGVEMPLEEVPSLQKMMIRQCHFYSRPVVTATQMLESMINNPRPTRAEVSDVANAIYDGTSAVMLSGETAVGLYPVETVRIMKNIICEAERHFDYQEFFSRDKTKSFHEISSAVAYAAVNAAYTSYAKAIFAYTNSGFTARLLSKFRPDIPVFALTHSSKVYHQMSLLWGVTPVEPELCSNVTQAFDKVSRFAMKQGLVSYGDLVVITSGSAFGVSGSTNTVTVNSIGDVLVRGRPGCGERMEGRVAILFTTNESSIEYVRGKIVVMSKCSDQFLPALTHAIGIVLQSNSSDAKSEKSAIEIAKSLGIPIITRAPGALTLLKEGVLVTIDPENGIVYNGSLPIS
ncbi:MAG: pyruvate kinase [Chlamydiia bacterium]